MPLWNAPPSPSKSTKSSKRGSNLFRSRKNASTSGQDNAMHNGQGELYRLSVVPVSSTQSQNLVKSQSSSSSRNEVHRQSRQRQEGEEEAISLGVLRLSLSSDAGDAQNRNRSRSSKRQQRRQQSHSPQRKLRSSTTTTAATSSTIQRVPSPRRRRRSSSKATASSTLSPPREVKQDPPGTSPDHSRRNLSLFRRSQSTDQLDSSQDTRGAGGGGLTRTQSADFALTPVIVDSPPSLLRRTSFMNRSRSHTSHAAPAAPSVVEPQPPQVAAVPRPTGPLSRMRQSLANLQLKKKTTLDNSNNNNNNNNNKPHPQQQQKHHESTPVMDNRTRGGSGQSQRSSSGVPDHLSRGSDVTPLVNNCTPPRTKRNLQRPTRFPAPRALERNRGPHQDDPQQQQQDQEDEEEETSTQPDSNSPYSYHSGDSLGHYDDDLDAVLDRNEKGRPPVSSVNASRRSVFPELQGEDAYEQEEQDVLPPQAAVRFRADAVANKINKQHSTDMQRNAPAYRRGRGRQSRDKRQSSDVDYDGDEPYDDDDLEDDDEEEDFDDDDAPLVRGSLGGNNTSIFQDIGDMCVELSLASCPFSHNTSEPVEPLTSVNSKTATTTATAHADSLQDEENQINHSSSCGGQGVYAPAACGDYELDQLQMAANAARARSSSRTRRSSRLGGRRK